MASGVHSRETNDAGVCGGDSTDPAAVSFGMGFDSRFRRDSFGKTSASQHASCQQLAVMLRASPAQGPWSRSPATPRLSNAPPECSGQECKCPPSTQDHLAPRPSATPPTTSGTDANCRKLDVHDSFERREQAFRLEAALPLPIPQALPPAKQPLGHLNRSYARGTGPRSLPHRRSRRGMRLNDPLSNPACSTTDRCGAAYGTRPNCTPRGRWTRHGQTPWPSLARVRGSVRAAPSSRPSFMRASRAEM